MNCSASTNASLRTAAILVTTAAFAGGHIASALRHPDGVLALAALQDLGTGALILTTRPTRRWLGPGVAFALLLALAVGAGQSPAAALLANAGAAHAMLYTALLLAFANSLRPGRTALVTVLASRINPAFHPGLIPYTRAVTVAWVLFFAAQLLASATLLVSNPHLWRLLVSGVHLPLVAAMALLELAVRRLRWGRSHPTGLLETVRGTRRLWAQRAANSATAR